MRSENATSVLCSPLIKKMSVTILGPSPRYFWTNSDPTTLMKEAVVWWATALASIVLPQPEQQRVQDEDIWDEISSIGAFVNSMSSERLLNHI